MRPLLGQPVPGRGVFRVNDAQIYVLGGHCSGHGRSCGVMRPPVLGRRRGFLRIRSQGAGQEHQRPTVAVPPNVFRTPKEKAGLQGFLSNIPRGLSYLGALCMLGLSAVAGYSAGGKAPADARTVSRAVGTAVGVGTAAFAILKMEETRQEAAAVDLHNSLVGRNDPGTLTRSEVEEIEQKYGVKMHEKLAVELKSIYDRYLTSMIPRGRELMGNEADKVASFKDALGISDEDAAAVHMDVGRRLARLSVESESKASEVDARKTFQKWIYISYRVFGERRSAFLLPLQRVFGLTQAQIMVARRDNAKSIFKSKITEMGGTFQTDRKFLEPLRAFQLQIMLKDEVAGEVVKDAARIRVESSLDSALKNVRERTRKKDYGLALKEIQGVLEFNHEMEILGNTADDRLPPGLGKVTMHGGVFEQNVNTADQRDLFRVFLEERLALDGQITVNLEKDLEDLSVVLALGPKEADSIREEVASKLYRKLLRDEVTSGRLDSAESKATVLQKLCDRVRFKPELAALMHKSMYKQKVEAILVEEKKITDERDEELSRLRKLMCIPERDVEDVMLECVGGLLKVAIDDALSAGLENFGEEDRKNVRRAIEELRTGEKMAMSVLTSSARQAFMKYVSQSRLKPNKLEAAKELKKMVFFSNIVVAPLIQDIKGDDEAQKAAAQAEFQEIMEEAKRKAAEEEAAEKENASDSPDASSTSDGGTGVSDEVKILDDDTATPETADGDSSEEMPSSLKKSNEGVESFNAEDINGSKKETSQKEITLQEDLDIRDRVDMYRNYLIYCMSGDVMQMPMGGTVVLERDASEFGRLSQLGDVLGLTQIDVMKVHTDMAEEAYRNQVKAILADGIITKEKTDALTEVREKLGLNKEQGDKIVQGVQNEALARSMESAKAMGELDLEKVLDMKESGVDIKSFTSPEFRKSLFQKEATKVMSNGKGDLNRDYLLEQLPDDLVIDKDQALKIVKDAALSKSKLLTVQAMSDLRMKKLDNAVEDVNNLLVCTQIIGPEETNGATKWDRREEILDLYSVYYLKVEDEEKVSNVQSLFGVSDTEAAALKKTVDSGSLKWAEEVQKEDEIFF